MKKATVMIERAHEIVSRLPPSTIAFAYGSAIVPQKNVNPETRMIDLIIVVKDAQKWHQQNLRTNASHYSFPMGYLGEALITRLQHSTYGPQIYYNTILSGDKSNLTSFKYGVIDLRHLRHDLFTWQSLYISGRLHKPVHYLTHRCTPPSLADAIQSNLESAAAAALLMLPEQFEEAQLYAMIANLSYIGDVRMNLPLEPTTKPTDLVMPNLQQFRTLYQSAKPLCNFTHCNRHGVFTRDMHSNAQSTLCDFLPSAIRRQVAHSISDHMHHSRQASEHNMIAKAVMAALASVVSRSSVSQVMKGLLTAGMTNSLKYVNAKLQKTLRRTSRLPYLYYKKN